MTCLANTRHDRVRQCKEQGLPHFPLLLKNEYMLTYFLEVHFHPPNKASSAPSFQAVTDTAR
jgi:hypothetical protein